MQKYLLNIIINEYIEDSISQLEPLSAVKAYTYIMQYTRFMSPLRGNGVHFFSSQIAVANRHMEQFLQENNVKSEATSLENILLDEDSPEFLGLRSRNDNTAAPITYYNVQDYVREKIKEEICKQINKMDLNQVFELPPIHYDLAKAHAIDLVKQGANLSGIDDMGYPLRKALIMDVNKAVRQSIPYMRHAIMGADQPNLSNNEYQLGAPNTPQFRRPGT